jgi:integrase/recombinase XerD
MRPRKTHQARVLPLAPEVGAALVASLTTARPPSTRRDLFLCRHPPFRPFAGAVGISPLVPRTLPRAAITPRPRMGAHLFRPTVASPLGQRGASFKAVADILGQRSLQSTGIYAKLDLAALTAVALPWGGGEQCEPQPSPPLPTSIGLSAPPLAGEYGPPPWRSVAVRREGCPAGRRTAALTP